MLVITAQGHTRFNGLNDSIDARTGIALFECPDQKGFVKTLASGNFGGQQQCPSSAPTVSDLVLDGLRIVLCQGTMAAGAVGPPQF